MEQFDTTISMIKIICLSAIQYPFLLIHSQREILNSDDTIACNNFINQGLFQLLNKTRVTDLLNRSKLLLTKAQ